MGTHLQSGGENARKAIALYYKALKMKPSDLTIRLYIAKAHFHLKEWDKCCAVLADATQLWPDDLLLRYNMAVALECHGVHLVALEKKTNRVVGVDSGMDQMVQAVDLLASAARLYNHVHVRWASMADRERRKVAASGGAPANLHEEMARVVLHKEYCSDITDAARDELEALMKKKQAMDAQMRHIIEEKNARDKEADEKAARSKKDDEQNQAGLEGHAVRLMEDGMDIELGKDLASKTLAMEKKAPVPRKKTSEGTSRAESSEREKSKGACRLYCTSRRERKKTSRSRSSRRRSTFKYRFRR